MKNFLLSIVALMLFVSAGFLAYRTPDLALNKSFIENQSEKTVPDQTDVAATVNGKAITIDDFQRRLHKVVFVLKAQGQAIPGNSQSEQLAYLENEVMYELVLEQMLLKAAELEGTVPSEQELDQVIEGIKQNFPSEEEFRATMQARGLSELTIRNYNRVQLIKDKLIQRYGTSERLSAYLDQLAKQANIKINTKLTNPVIAQAI